MKNGMAILATMLSGLSNFSYRDPNKSISVEFKGVTSLSEEQKHIKNGLKLFEYQNGHVYALNQKNADRKAKKLGYTK